MLVPGESIQTQSLPPSPVAGWLPTNQMQLDGLQAVVHRHVFMEWKTWSSININCMCHKNLIVGLAGR